MEGCETASGCIRLRSSQPVLRIGPDACGNKVLPESRTSIYYAGLAASL